MNFPIDITLLIIIAAPVVFVICVVGLIIYFRRNCVESRYRATRLLGALRYIKEVVVEREYFPNRPRKLTKRDKRRVKLRQFLVSHKQQQDPQYDEEKQEEEEIDEDEQVNNFLDRFMRSFKGLSPSSKQKSTKSMKPSSPSSKFFSWFSAKTEISEGPQIETSTRSKRFISQDRIQRAEARKLLIKMKSAKIYDIEEAPELKTENVISILDMEEKILQRQTELIEARKQKQELRKELQKQQNPDYIDRIQLNGGPLPHQIPKGYKVIHFITDIEPQTILYKRCLYLWEGKHLKVNGWFLGTIGSVSKQPGCNFNIKYDRKETLSLFADGFRSVHLSLAGDQAYGRRWVILEKIEKQKYLRGRSRSPNSAGFSPSPSRDESTRISQSIRSQRPPSPQSTIRSQRPPSPQSPIRSQRPPSPQSPVRSLRRPSPQSILYEEGNELT